MELVSKELNEKAIELANKSLAKGFDWQAFLVLSLAQQNLLSTPQIDENVSDLVQDSNVDENIQLFLKKFIKFSKLKKQNINNEQVINELNILLSFLKKIINELYFSSETTEEKQTIIHFLSNIKLG